MKGNIIVCWAARLSGALLILSVIPHYFFAMPARVLQPIADGRVDADLGKTYYAIWVFASLTLLITGVTLIYISSDLRKLQRRAWWMGLFISGGLTFYGSYVVIKFNETTHNTSFIIFGSITLLPLLIFFKSYFKRDDRL
jgi:hypothetical protein